MTNAGLFTSETAAQAARRGGAVKRARRDRRIAERLQTEAERLLSQADDLRQRADDDLARFGLDHG